VHRRALPAEYRGVPRWYPRPSPPAPAGSPYHDTVLTPPVGDTWLALSSAPLPIAAASEWAVRPDCGAVVTFSGTARDHSDGRPDVSVLEYEAYEAQVEPRLAQIADHARAQWPQLARLALLHRVGALSVGESAVLVVASAPHRDEAFLAARYCIDTLKDTVPIWKRESWAGGDEWGLDGQPITDVAAVDSVR